MPLAPAILDPKSKQAVWNLDFGFWIAVVSVLFVEGPNAVVWILDLGFWILDLRHGLDFAKNHCYHTPTRVGRILLQVISSQIKLGPTLFVALAFGASFVWLACRARAALAASAACPPAHVWRPLGGALTLQKFFSS